MPCCLVVLLSRFLAPLLCRETCFFGDNPLSFCDVALSLGVLTRCLCHCSPVFGVLLCDIHGGVPPPCLYHTLPRRSTPLGKNGSRYGALSRLHLLPSCAYHFFDLAYLPMKNTEGFIAFLHGVFPSFRLCLRLFFWIHRTEEPAVSV